MTDNKRIAPQRASSGVSREPTTARPPFELFRIATQDSVVKNCEATYADAGLSLGRATRAGWGAGGQVAFSGKLASPYQDM